MGGQEPSEHAIDELLGSLELSAMRALWVGSPATVRLVLERVNATRPDALAYTSVMTVLDRLHDKGLVTRERAGRAWEYTPVHEDETRLVGHLGRRQVDELVDRFGTVALVHFVAALDELDVATRRQLEELADDDS